MLARQKFAQRITKNKTWILVKSELATVPELLPENGFDPQLTHTGKN